MSTEHAYIASGATLRCDRGGTLPGSLFIPTRSVSLGDQPIANEHDRDPVVNQLNFGVCALTQKPCAATIRPLKWLDVKADLEVAGGKALLDCSKLPCALGGTIAFVHHGQTI